jgi:hypothetical protein
MRRARDVQFFECHPAKDMKKLSLLLLANNLLLKKLLRRRTFMLYSCLGHLPVYNTNTGSVECIIMEQPLFYSRVKNAATLSVACMVMD